MNAPYLRIVEQPEQTTRLRYQSEKKQIYLYGENSPTGGAKSHKTYPQVELMNYSGEALIKVQLCQEDSKDLHPADKALTDRSRHVSQEDGDYLVKFDKIKINLMKNDEVIKWLMKESHKTAEECKPLAEKINKHAVRLRFSAIDPDTSKMICPPVYSSTVKHCKERLSVVNYQICRGSAKGGETFWLAVDGITIRKNIKIIFFEEMTDGTRHEFAEIPLNDSHFHHAHLIMTQTPPYHRELSYSKKVYFILRDVEDLRESESRSFEYTPSKIPEGRTHSDSISSASTGYSSWTPRDACPKTRKRRHQGTSKSLCSQCNRKLSSSSESNSAVVDYFDLTSESEEVTNSELADDNVYLPEGEVCPNYLDYLAQTDIPIEPSPSIQQPVSTIELYCNDEIPPERLTSHSNPVLGEANVFMDNGASYQPVQEVYFEHMDADDWMSEDYGEFVADSVTSQKSISESDRVNRFQLENIKPKKNLRHEHKTKIYKTASSQHSVGCTQKRTLHADPDMWNMFQQYAKMELHDERALQYDSSTSDGYETAEEDLQ